MDKPKFVQQPPVPGGSTYKLAVPPVPSEDVLEAIKDAFFCGIVRGRFDERCLTCPRTADNPIEQEEEEDERAKVEAEYLSTWPGDLLLAGFFAAVESIDDLVRAAEDEGWQKKQAKAGAADTSK